MNQEHQAVVNYWFEAGILNKTQRSGFWFLGTGEQSVAEHTHRMLHIVFALAHLTGKDPAKLISMALFHDFAEGRTGDLNWINQKYAKSDEEKVIQSLTKTLPFGEAMKAIVEEYEARQSEESILVKEADSLELILTLKELADVGNPRASEWIPSLLARLKTEIGRQLAEVILETKSDQWWRSGGPSDDPKFMRPNSV